MFIHNIDPVLFSLGPLQVRYYGLAYIFGFILGYLYLRSAIKNKLIKNLSLEQAEDLILYIGFGVIIGSRFFDFVFYNPGVFLTNPLEVFKIWNGGMSMHGGLIGTAIAIFIFSKKYKTDLLELADILVFPAIIGLAFGRITNFINGELYGTITNVPWCVKFQAAEGCRHPYQIYASLSHFITFGILHLHKRWHRYKGQLFYYFLIYYGALRFLTDFFRDDPRFFGISTGQFLSLTMVALGLFFLWRNRK